MKATIEQVKEIVSILTDEQQQVLKDAIRFGMWGDAEEDFLNENGEIEKDVPMMAYCTSEAKLAGNFNGRKISSMFRAIYSKLCPSVGIGSPKGIGRYISHHSDWWDNGSGDMIFIRTGYYDAFEQWARI